MKSKNLSLYVCFVLLIGLTASGCITTTEPFVYDLVATVTTPKGVRIDPSGNKVDPKAIDCIIDRVEACLIRKFGNPPVLPIEVRQASWCGKETFQVPFAREKLGLKIPDEIPTVLVGLEWQPVTRDGLGWHLNCDGTQQLLTLAAHDSGCEAKGLTPTSSCPCRWRANMLDQNTIVAPPSLYIFPDWLIRWATGCQNPWAHPALAECATPVTGPLDKVAACTPD